MAPDCTESARPRRRAESRPLHRPWVGSSKHHQKRLQADLWISGVEMPAGPLPRADGALMGSAPGGM